MIWRSKTYREHLLRYSCAFCSSSSQVIVYYDFPEPVEELPDTFGAALCRPCANGWTGRRKAYSIPEAERAVGAKRLLDRQREAMADFIEANFDETDAHTSSDKKP